MYNNISAESYRALTFFTLSIIFLLVITSCDSIFGTSGDKNERTEEPEDMFLIFIEGEGTNRYPNRDNNESGDYRVSVMASMGMDSLTTGEVSWETLEGVVQSYGVVYCLEKRENRVYISYRSEGGEFGGYGEEANTVLLGFEDNGESDNQTFVYFQEQDVECTSFANFIDAENGPGFPVEWIDGGLTVE